MNRRDFLATSGAGALAIAASRVALSDTRPAKISGKLGRVAVSSWSLHNLFAKTKEENAPAVAKPLNLLEFPEMIADKFHVHNLEIVAPHFESTEPSYLNDFKASLRKAHSRLINIPVDIGWLWDQPGLSDPNEAGRDKAVNAYLPWVSIAHDLGAVSIRCDPGKIDPKNLQPTIASYKRLSESGAKYGVYVIVENHGGVGSEHPEELIKILKAAGGHAGTLPDFGNFPDEETRHRGLELLFPLAPSLCHVRDFENGKKFDMAACVKISQKAKFRGWYSIESESGGDPYQDAQNTLDELLKAL